MSRNVALFILLLLGLGLFSAEAGLIEREDLLEQADKHYAEHSYTPALEAYRGVLEQKERAADERGHAALRIGLCLAKLKRWDDALAESEELEKGFAGTIWQARLRSLRGATSLAMPHYYYEKGEERSRTRWIQGSTYHYTYDDDLIRALNLLCSAWELWRPFYPKFESEMAEAERTRRGEEIGRVGLDMAAALEAHRNQNGGLLGAEPHPQVLEDLKKKVPALENSIGTDPQSWFTEVEKVSLLAKLREQAAMARYLEAMYAQRLMTSFPETKIRHENGETTVSCRVDPGESQPRFVQLPDEKNPFKLLKTLIELYPDASMIDAAVFVLARLQQQAELYLQALETVENFEKRFPKSRWNSDVLYMRQDIRYPRLSCSQPAPVRPGETVELTIDLRNMKELSVESRRFDLSQVMSSSSYLRDDELNLNDLGRIIDEFGRSRLVGRTAVHDLKRETPDQGKHLAHQMKIPLKFEESGAYLIELSSSDVTYRLLALVSDIALMRKTSNESTLVFVADAGSGHALEGASVTVRQKHRASGIFGKYDKMTWDAGKTDAQGLFERPHASADRNSIYIEAFAERGDDFALTFQTWSPNVSKEAENAVVYGFTDRPVYRPGETINWVANMRTRIGEDYENLADERFEVTVTDPRGNKIFDESLVTDDFGTLSAAITVGEEPPLGSYRIQYRRNRRYVGAHSFRIEEYKKPEFEVLVDGPDEAIRVGDTVPVTIEGRYYFGAAVADAKVAWRAFRESYHPTFNLREPYSWLYGRQKGRSWGSRERELIGQGEGLTDAEGRLVFPIDTADWSTRHPDEDHRLVFEVDMTDLSRRTISGSSGVVVPRRGLFLHVEAGRGFYRAGETIKYELRAQSPDGDPRSTKGQLTIFRVEARRDGEKIIESRTQVASMPAETDRKGFGLCEWQSDAPGRYVAQYRTLDRWAEPVVGEHATWVTDPDYRADDFQFKNLEVLTDKSEYQPGDRALVMINTVFPDSQVLVTVEAGPRRLSHQLITTKGKMAVMTLDIEEGYAPNVFVHAMTIRDGAFYESVQEVFVPPTHRFLDLDLRFDKPVYLPGELATLDIAARNAAGEGVDARLALRVMDRAITYIQEDTTADIRKFFYGQRRGFLGEDSWNSNLRNSQQFRFQGHLSRTPRWVDHDTHGMPSGFYFDLSMTDALYDLDFSEESPSRGERKRGFFSDGALASGDEQVWEKKENAESEDSFAEGSLKAPASRRLADQSLNATAPSESPMHELDEAGMAEAELRGNFSDLATWQPDLRTGEDGHIQIQFRFPDSLTDWQATARGITRDTRVGIAETTIKTTKNVMVRLQAPRFFTEKDEVVISALVRNEFDEAIDAKVSLEIEGDNLEILSDRVRTLAVGPRQELRVDWRTRVLKSGEVQLTTQVLSARESDAMRMRFPVLRYGATKTLTRSTVMEGEGGEVAFPLEVPADRRISESRLELRLQPSLAATMMESLPYLIEYPYGCTEQTMSRFMPAVIVARTLQDMGTSLDEISRRRQDLMNRDDLNVREIGPLYSDRQLEALVAAGLRRLASMQNSDGGFGWWSRDHSSVHLTSYVLHGLCEARDAGREVSENMINRAAAFLESELADSVEIHPKAYGTFVLARAGRKVDAFLDDVMARRDRLSTQGKAQLVLALQAAGRKQDARLVLRNLEDFAKTAPDEGLVWWEGGSSWWRWYDDEVETNAWVLMAMAEVDPQHRHSRGLLRWMIHNRTGNRWKSTCDTALSVLAMSKVAKGLGEFEPDYEVIVHYGDQVLHRVQVNAENMFAFDNRIELVGDAIATGPLPLRVERRGRGTLYVDCRLTFFSQEDRIEAAGYQVEVAREYYRLEPIEKVVEVNGKKEKRLDYERTKLDHLAEVQAGDQIEVKLLVTAANNYEYIMLEDRKPAGFEPLELKSGGRYANGLCSNMELRDEKVVFFVTWLQRGTHEISYRMRAEVPGVINAMPTRAEAMYAPRIGGISDSWRVVVTDPSE